MSEALNALMKSKFEMKTFTHTPLPESSVKEVYTETINKKRFYVTPDGHKYPSITTVLSGRAKEGINAWRERVGEAVANQIMRTAAKRGTAVHELCEDYLNNKEYTLKHMPSNLNLFRTIKPILDKNVELVYHQEVPLYSDKLRAAGRVDCVCKWNGKDAIVDFKTSSKPKKKEWIQDYFIQATAYSLMFEYVTTYHIPNIVICMAIENNEPIVFEDTIYPYVPQLLSKVEEYHAHFEDESIAHQIANAGA